MTAAQKVARDNFKKAIAYRQKTGVSLKEAFAHVQGKKVGAVKKKATKKAKLPKAKTVKVSKQKNNTKSKKADKRVQALPPGKRLSKYGTTYYERRSNRSDKGVLLGNAMPSKFVSLSGYNTQKEIVVASVGNVSKLKNLVPEVEVKILRKTRGKKFIVSSPTDSVEAFRTYIKDEKIETQEIFAIAYLKQNNEVIGVYSHTIGTMNSVSIDVRLVMSAALSLGASNMIICHNHPSGNLRPSEADRRLTSKLREACALYDINLLDHIILTKDNYYSFADSGDM
jgi:DNA repair protein RadC